ncbi:hypothetical protein [Elizabethkingia miricola]|uniref:hypothetical protein n=1 Tax=Elizabethkingia miricola TaxID=172045 RepID=UPI001F44440A|nr:hypothetical protein [Elizabethkingia miricola]UIO97083.1 hypothetical protein LYZ41_03140 [Elizabethkingia miricola]WER13867.1 hypothetical protein P0M31_03150 [Elizabethkingia miricola]WGL74044.1 hypothetical protein QFB80_03145 [Elizabethkingia miricola]WNG65771.1 hypothetical protein M9H57_03140 [Elizabethkingia miricola]
MKKIKFKSKLVAGCFTAALLIFTSVACSKDNRYEKTNPGPKEVQLRNDVTLGSVLTDKDGSTLYYFANDATTTNNCTGGCEPVWPIFNIDNLSAEKLGMGLELSDFKSITTGSGKK